MIGNPSLWLVLQHAFTLRFPQGHHHHKDPLKLCFETEEEALEWRATIARVIKGTDDELQKRDTGKVLGEMARKTDELHEAEQSQPSLDGLRRISSMQVDSWT